jgi:hypothetical protein
MKKVIYLLTGAAITVLASCGPSAEEKAAEEKRIQDSIATVEAARVQDSIAAAEKMVQDSIASVQKAMEDSLRMKAMADSIAAASKKGGAPKPKPKPKSPEEKKIEQQIKEVKDATRGRG